jgi:hypothetical protein
MGGCGDGEDGMARLLRLVLWMLVPMSEGLVLVLALVFLLALPLLSLFGGLLEDISIVRGSVFKFGATILGRRGSSSRVLTLVKGTMGARMSRETALCGNKDFVGLHQCSNMWTMCTLTQNSR